MAGCFYTRPFKTFFMTKEQQVNEIINEADELVKLLDKAEHSPSNLHNHAVKMQKRKLKVSILLYRTAPDAPLKQKKKPQNFINNSYKWLAR